MAEGDSVTPLGTASASKGAQNMPIEAPNCSRLSDDDYDVIELTPMDVTRLAQYFAVLEEWDTRQRTAAAAKAAALGTTDHDGNQPITECGPVRAR
jgi:hypothetical protein